MDNMSLRTCVVVKQMQSKTRESMIQDTIPKKSNPWFDQECRDALKTRRALDNKVKHGCGPHQGTLISFKRAQVRARQFFNQKKRDSWRNHVSQVTPNTPTKHVRGRVRKISGKNICPPKQYLRGKDSKAVTTPRDVANEHAVAFADISSSAHYSQEFHQIKEEAEKENSIWIRKHRGIQLTLQTSGFKRGNPEGQTKSPWTRWHPQCPSEAPPEESLVVLKDILNGIWISGHFPAQWRAASVVPIPKPGKDQSDPLNYRPIILTSCLCKIMNKNDQSVLDLVPGEEWNPQQEPAWLQKAQMHNRPFGQPGEVCPWCICPQTTSSWSLLWPWKGIRDNLAVWYHAWFTQGWIEKKASHLCFWEPQGPQVQGVWWCDPIRRIWYKGVPTGRVLTVTCFGLKINDLPRHIPPDILRALFVDDLAICFRGSSLYAIERHLQHTVDAIQGWALQNGFKFAGHKCKILHFTAPRHKPERHPNIMISHVALPVEETTKFLGLCWDLKLNFGKHITAKKNRVKKL